MSCGFSREMSKALVDHIVVDSDESKTHISLDIFLTTGAEPIVSEMQTSNSQLQMSFQQGSGRGIRARMRCGTVCGGTLGSRRKNSKPARFAVFFFQKLFFYYFPLILTEPPFCSTIRPEIKITLSITSFRLMRYTSHRRRYPVWRRAHWSISASKFNKLENGSWRMGE